MTRIEEAIKQSKFQDVYQKALVNLIYTANCLRDEQVRRLKSFDLLPQHFNVMRILRGRHPNPVCPGEIKEVMLDKANDLTRLLDKLERKGLIQRNLCPTNRRKMDVTLTQAGIELLEKLNHIMEETHKTLKERLSEREAASLSHLLDKMRG
ncbi:DNA-binding MarR family transcriptional regulator [Thermoflavifilum aggregans]|uniref:DNA-binding MarR family transcriptional regulator n=1 Tax=Thermoflavifilum aggregans TaxID=454188 RepID=A0A2M9CV95_9BACT|nr:MarR family transcriptional regulator [Thermoflavifilum aggregans]PJJ75844.1 DNA-binding MarR family transcriptional regulator [Thermoflavifilum aggregans]